MATKSLLEVAMLVREYSIFSSILDGLIGILVLDHNDPYKQGNILQYNSIVGGSAPPI